MFDIHFKAAFEGIVKVITTQRTFQVMLAIALITIVAALFLRFTTTEWFVLILMITMVLSAEMFNTSIEFLADRVNNRKDSAIRLVKDISAASVLTTALISIAVGIMLFYPKILMLLK